MEDLGKLFLRLTIGGLMLFHGIDKIRHGVTGISNMLGAKGLPEFFAYGVYVGEVVAPVLIIVGLWTRPAAAIFAFNMLVATVLVHAGDVFALGKHGAWGVELQALYMFGALAIVMLGPGAISASGGNGAWD